MSNLAEGHQGWDRNGPRVPVGVGPDARDSCLRAEKPLLLMAIFADLGASLIVMAGGLRPMLPTAGRQ